MRMNLKNMLSEIKHKKSHITLFHSYEISRTDKSIKTEADLWSGEGENGEQLLNKYGVLFGGDENILELDRSGGCITL